MTYLGMILVNLLLMPFLASADCTLAEVNEHFQETQIFSEAALCIESFCRVDTVPEKCVSQKFESSLSWGGFITEYITDKKAAKLESLLKSQAVKSQFLRMDARSTVREIDALNKLIAKARQERLATEVSTSQKFFETGSESLETRLKIREQHLAKLGDEVKALRDSRYLEQAYASHLDKVKKIGNAGRASTGMGVGMMLAEMKGDTPCSIIGSQAVTEVDAHCNPIPILGESELSFLKLSDAEKRKKLKQYPQLCSHFEDIAKNIKDKTNILASLYFSDVKISDLACSDKGVSYRLKGNEFVGEGLVQATYNSDKKIQRLIITDDKSALKEIDLNYADDGKNQVVNSIRWESSDPKDNWMGGRSVLRTQFESAQDNPIVERSGILNRLHLAYEEKIQKCCADQNQCQNIGIKGVQNAPAGRKKSQ